MLRRKQINIFIFVLIAFIVLGVGYAAISNIDLVVNGTGSVTATQSNFDVRFLDVDGHRPAITPGSPNTINVLGNTTATFSVSTLSKKGDTAVATIDVKNESNGVGTRIGLNLTNSNETYFKVTEHIADTELQVGDITTVTVTIEMLKTPISANETTNITATLTANPIENSSATGSDSKSVIVPKLWTLPAGRTATTLQVGDELQFKDQSFYFIRYDENNKAVLLAKYNLKVGYIYNNSWSIIGQYTSTNPGYGMQSSDAKAFISASTYNGIVPFSATNYWYDGSNLKSTYGSSYTNNNIYDKNYATEPDFSTTCNYSTNCFNTSGYSVVYYVERYKDILKGVGYGATIDDARLLLYSEANSITGTNAISNSSSILRKTSFWLGSANEYNSVWAVMSNRSVFMNATFGKNDSYGVRPVLVVSPSNF